MDSSGKFCPYCGIAVKHADTFCNNCGASLDVTAEPITSTPISDPVQDINPFASEPVTTPVQQPKKPTQYATISLILGIVSVCIGLIPFASFYIEVIAGGLAILTGFLSFKENQKMGFAIAGIILGFIGVGFFVLSMIGYDIWDYILP